jgi:hypothetical protein
MPKEISSLTILQASISAIAKLGRAMTIAEKSITEAGVELYLTRIALAVFSVVSRI